MGHGRVEHWRNVAVGEHEAVALAPKGILGIVFERMEKEIAEDICHTQGPSGMAGARLKERLYAGAADRVRLLREKADFLIVQMCHGLVSDDSVKLFKRRARIFCRENCGTGD